MEEEAQQEGEGETSVSVLLLPILEVLLDALQHSQARKQDAPPRLVAEHRHDAEGGYHFAGSKEESEG